MLIFFLKNKLSIVIYLLKLKVISNMVIVLLNLLILMYKATAFLPLPKFSCFTIFFMSLLALKLVYEVLTVGGSHQFLNRSNLGVGSRT